jgi:hypothetical protein
VSAVSIVVRDLEDQAASPELAQDPAGCKKQVELRSIIDSIVYALRDLEELATKYSSLSTAQKNNWDRLRLPSEKIRDIRTRLCFHTSLAQNILDGQANRSIARIERSGRTDSATLTRIEQAVQDIVKNLKQDSRSASVVSDEGWSFWAELKRELRIEGYPAKVVGQHRDQIKQYLLNLLQNAGVKDMVLVDDFDLSGGEDNDYEPDSVRSHGSDHEKPTLLVTAKHLSRPVKTISFLTASTLTGTFVVFLLLNISYHIFTSSKFFSGLSKVDPNFQLLPNAQSYTKQYDSDLAARLGDYLQACFLNDTVSLLAQSTIPQQKIDFHIETLSACPLPDYDICQKATDFINFETGTVDANMIGIKSTYEFRPKTIYGPSIQDKYVLMITSDQSDAPDFMPPFNASLTLFYDITLPNQHQGGGLLDPVSSVVQNLTNLNDYRVLWDYHTNEGGQFGQQIMGFKVKKKVLEISTTYNSTSYRGQGAFWTQEQVDGWVPRIIEDYSGLISAITIAAEWGWATWSGGEIDFMLLGSPLEGVGQLDLERKLMLEHWDGKDAGNEEQTFWTKILEYIGLIVTFIN